jgi:hypothetical protein
VVVISEAERPVPVTYAKRVRGMKLTAGGSTYLPLRLNQAGVIPIIFALSLLLIPQMFASFFQTSSHPFLVNLSSSILAFFQNLTSTAAFTLFLYFFFTYFYTAVTFDPHQISENLQKNGAFIPGVRPGVSTSEYLAKIITRITFVGALFLAIVAVLPIIMQSITGIQSLALGGTALLIVVSSYPRPRAPHRRADLNTRVLVLEPLFVGLDHDLNHFFEWVCGGVYHEIKLSFISIVNVIERRISFYLACRPGNSLLKDFFNGCSVLAYAPNLLHVLKGPFSSKMRVDLEKYLERIRNPMKCHPRIYNHIALIAHLAKAFVYRVVNFLFEFGFLIDLFDRKVALFCHCPKQVT